MRTYQSRLLSCLLILSLLLLPVFIPSASAAVLKDNPSLYQGYHRLAESEGGFYYLSGGLLHYVNTQYQLSTVLSASGASDLELRENRSLRHASDAYFPGASCVFYLEQVIYVLCQENVAGNEWALFSLPEEGGLRKRLCTFYAETGHAALLNGTIYTVCTEYNALNQGVRYIEGYDIKNAGKTEKMPFPDIEGAGFQEIAIQRIIPWQNRLYMDLIILSEEGILPRLLAFDPFDNQASLIDTQAILPEADLVSQAVTFHQDKILFNLLPKSYTEQSEVVVYAADANGQQGASYETLPFSRNMLSNGEQIVIVPPAIAFLFQSGLLEMADPHAHPPLQVSSYQGGEISPIFTIDPVDLHMDGRFICLSSTGELFLTQDEGLYLDLITPEGLVNFLAVEDINQVN